MGIISSAKSSQLPLLQCTWIKLCSYPYIQVTRHLQDHKFPFYNKYHLSLPVSLLPASWWPLICSPLKRYCYFKNDIKCNHTVCSLWDSFFPLTTKPWRHFKVLHISSFFLFFSSVLWNEYTTFHFNILLIKTSVLISFWLLQTKMLWILFLRFLYEHKLLFLWDKCPSVIVR
jgi:hypothetical protein